MYDGSLYSYENFADFLVTHDRNLRFGIPASVVSTDPSNTEGSLLFSLDELGLHDQHSGAAKLLLAGEEYTINLHDGSISIGGTDTGAVVDVRRKLFIYILRCTRTGDISSMTTSTPLLYSDIWNKFREVDVIHAMELWIPCLYRPA